MAKYGKKYSDSAKLIDKSKAYDPSEALELVCQTSKAKFDETIVEKNGDVEKEIESKIFPCYVLIKMTMTEESWHAVRNITGVTGFVGPGSRPTPLSDAEVDALNIETKRVELKVKVGDNVIIGEGLFEGYNGIVQAVSDDLKIVTVLIKKGRRDMPVELDAGFIKIKEN